MIHELQVSLSRSLFQVEIYFLFLGLEIVVVVVCDLFVESYVFHRNFSMN